jgi:hypothetical protein
MLEDKDAKQIKLFDEGQQPNSLYKHVCRLIAE